MPSVRFKVRRADDKTFVHLLFSHPMETGRNKDAKGVTIPAWYLTEVDLQLNDESVSRVGLTTLASKNPVLYFELSGAQTGDSLKVTWKDNLSKAGEATTKLAE